MDHDVYIKHTYKCIKSTSYVEIFKHLRRLVIYKVDIDPIQTESTQFLSYDSLLKLKK